MESSVDTILDRNNVGFVNKLTVYIPTVPWLSALQAVGLGRRNVSRKFVLTTHIISVKHGRYLRSHTPQVLDMLEYEQVENWENTPHRNTSFEGAKRVSCNMTTPNGDVAAGLVSPYHNKGGCAKRVTKYKTSNASSGPGG